MKTASSKVSESLTTGFNQHRVLPLSSLLFPCTIQADTWVVANASQLIDIAHPWEVLPLFGKFRLVFPLFSHTWTSPPEKPTLISELSDFPINLLKLVAQH